MKSETNSISERTALNLAYGPSSTLFLFATDIMYGWFQIKRITYMRNAIFRSHLHFLLHEYTQLWECDWIFGLKLKFYIFPIIFFFLLLSCSFSFRLHGVDMRFWYDWMNISFSTESRYLPFSAIVLWEMWWVVWKTSTQTQLQLQPNW